MQVILEIVEGPETGKKIWLMRGQEVQVGRTTASEFHLENDPELSSVHFGVTYSDKGVELADCGSSNGTYVNGEKVDKIALRNGDEIRAGRSTVTVIIKGEPGDDEDEEGFTGKGTELSDASTGGPDSPPSSEQGSGTTTLEEPPESLYNTVSAKEICEPLELSDEAIALLAEGLSPREYISLLVEQAHFPDAVPFLARALLKRQAVWWALSCVEMVKPDDLEAPLVEALNCAREWLADPTEENRFAAFQAGTASEYKGPASWVALGAGWSSGSLAPPDLPPVPPDEHLTAQAVVGAVMLAATEGEAELVEGKYKQFFEKGVAVAEGEDSW